MIPYCIRWCDTTARMQPVTYTLLGQCNHCIQHSLQEPCGPAATEASHCKRSIDTQQLLFSLLLDTISHLPSLETNRATQLRLDYVLSATEYASSSSRAVVNHEFLSEAKTLDIFFVHCLCTSKCLKLVGGCVQTCSLHRGSPATAASSSFSASTARWNPTPSLPLNGWHYKRNIYLLSLKPNFETRARWKYGVWLLREFWNLPDCQIPLSSVRHSARQISVSDSLDSCG